MAHIFQGPLKRSAAKFLHPARFQAVVGITLPQQSANLTSVKGMQSETLKSRGKPWNYEKHPYNHFYFFIDNTLKRFNDNSKVIVIDGNIGVGKTEFGKKLAEEFDMYFFPDIDSNDIFKIKNRDFDVRMVNDVLPVDVRFCDMPTFYEQKVPRPQLLRFGYTQLQMYKARYFNYLKALVHILNTGQGVVVERSVFSDMVFVDAMRKFKHLTPPGHRHLHYARTNTICELWRPHLVVYLDAPVSHVREQIQKRNVPWEVKSPALTDDFIAEISSVYKNKYLEEMKTKSEIIQYNVTDMPDWEIIVEDFEDVDLEPHLDADPFKFVDWMLSEIAEEDYCSYRFHVSQTEEHNSLFYFHIPFDAPEMFWNGEDAHLLNNYIDHDPAVETDPNYRGWGALFKSPF
ncbi:NADH dehydrogenase [ubiquinone] 1 alpha subcomplex subunit 10, mitochondrial [Patella vulgata]|uniref:NADH dehydrogenase [ubiquinone] 1 alpha subcomplex subunit 10, mitochondrial n=1 Tax=Patella vulgata TaxID=6465 RepID=UPI00217FF713|nr:NADH dehydrogenase [ubiquinone] 1 alpha subcomplex subunit 10, mitochondrial [Patella vulgata]